MTVNNILIFLMVLSTVYMSRFVIEFFIKFFSEEPSILKLSKVESVFFYFAISYFITFIIT